MPYNRMFWLAYGLLATFYVIADEPVASREQLNATLWIQQSEEFRATALQIYHQAQQQLKPLLHTTGTAATEQTHIHQLGKLKPAIILDVDQTVLDNTDFNAGLVSQGKSFNKADWDAWIMARQARAIPGARSFIQHARKLGYRVIFMTNRACNKTAGYDDHGNTLDCPQKKATLDNLQKVLGYRPQEQDLLMRFELKERDDYDKKSRRVALASQIRIVMLLGDDLNDFIRRTEYYEQRHGTLWGKRWFMIPNPMYGSWLQSFETIPAKYAALNSWSADTSLQELRIASWNLEWLADPVAMEKAKFWSFCSDADTAQQRPAPDLPVCNAYQRYSIQNADDYNRKKLMPLRLALSTLAQQHTDIIALQEIQNSRALEAVLPGDYRIACITTREDAQNLAFVVRTKVNLNFQCQEINEFSLEHQPGISYPVRRALQLTLSNNSQNISLLNIHLKSGCPKGRLDSSKNTNCEILQQQIPILEHWIESQAAKSPLYMILGDWNRDLQDEINGSFPARTDNSDPANPILDTHLIRNLWPEINDHSPTTSDMSLIAVERQDSLASACYQNLDHMVLSNTFKTLLNNDQISARLLPVPQGASDHCILQSHFKFKTSQ